MSKRCRRFARRERDFYATPGEAMGPLLPHLRRGTRFHEPCAGLGDMIVHLEAAGLVCAAAGDVAPQPALVRAGADVLAPWRPVPDAAARLARLPRLIAANRRIVAADARGLSACAGEVFITNPPWGRPDLHAILERLRGLAPVWALFDADWMHTRQAAPLLPYCHRIVSVGRVRWFPDSPHSGKDNCAWYLFKATAGQRRFYARAA